MALGRYGTALWLDNHTVEWSGPSERGQRLAGRVFPLGGEEGVNGDQASTTRASGMAAAAEPSAVSSTGAAMLFGVREDDAWTRVAMEEEAGLIALGHVDGAITLLEY